MASIVHACSVQWQLGKRARGTPDDMREWSTGWRFDLYIASLAGIKYAGAAHHSQASVLIGWDAQPMSTDDRVSGDTYWCLREVGWRVLVVHDSCVYARLYEGRQYRARGSSSFPHVAARVPVALRAPLSPLEGGLVHHKKTEQR